MTQPAYRGECVFCRIVAGESDARWEQKDAGKGAVCFHNQLRWERVMLLIVPPVHMTQEELWGGSALYDVAGLAVEMGEALCPEGFRVLSNFGRDAHQSQEHAHLHVISGLAQNIATATPSGNIVEHGGVTRQPHRVQDAPVAERFAHRSSASQREMLTGREFGTVARVAMGAARTWSPGGFRLTANYAGEENAVGGGPPGLFALGGGPLKLYV